MRVDTVNGDMCDYCDCRSISEIGDLSLEHERVLSLTHSLRHDTERPSGGIHDDLRKLHSVLTAHTQREEAGVFAVLASVESEPAYRQRFLDDHVEIDGLVEAALADHAQIPRLVELVERHVFEEETDLYPAIRQIFAPSDWHEVGHRLEALHDTSVTAAEAEPHSPACGAAPRT